MKKTLLFILVSFFMLTGTQSFAQIFMVFDGVKGESTFKPFPSSIQLNSLSWGAKNGTTATGMGGATVGRVQVSELVITKTRSASSPAMQMLVFNGKVTPKAEIRFYKQGANPSSYLIITLENVYISNWSISAEANGAPTESFSLVFTKFKTEDATIKPDGTVEKIPAVGWDIQRNTAN